MAIKARDVAVIIVERIEAAHPARAYFNVGETDEWPVGALAALLEQGLVVVADRADAIDCTGCEWQCHKHVEVRKARSVTRAFIVCDEEPDHGRISVPLPDLRRFATDLNALGVLVARLLKIGPVKASQSLATYALGSVTGRHGGRAIFVTIENAQLNLGVGDQREPMTRVLAWGSSGVTIDTKHVLRLAERKEGVITSRPQYARDRSQQSARKIATRQRDRMIAREAKRRQARGMTLTAIAAELAGTEVAPGLTPERVRRIITDQRALERQNSRPKPRRPK